MKNDPFKVGAVVKLRSGGPMMTVMSGTETNVKCAWFYGPESIPIREEHIFPIEALQEVE